MKQAKSLRADNSTEMLAIKPKGGGKLHLLKTPRASEDAPREAQNLTVVSPKAPAASATSSAPPAKAAAPALPLVGIGRLHSIAEGQILLELGGELVAAELDPTVHPTVIAGANTRGECVLVERQGERFVIVGALRTRPTPGIDSADEYAISAKRISLQADDELTLRAQASALVLRAKGEVETYAERIISRAEGVHKIIGRILRLN